MPSLSLLDRLRDFLTSRKFGWILTILFGATLFFYFLFVTFLFNPFEDPLEEIAAVVPREVEYFLRWENAGDRFDPFPTPAVWQDFKGSGVYASLEEAGQVEALGQSTGLAALGAELAGVVGALPAGLNLESDLLREIAIAGRGRPVLNRSFDGMLLLRASTKVRAGVSLLGFNFVRAKVIPSLGVEALGDGRFRIPQFGPFGFQDAFLGRVRDVVVLASRKEWLDFVHDLEIRSGEGSLARASIYRDNVAARTGGDGDPLEAFFRWSQVRDQIGTWPTKNATFYPTRVLASFFNSDFLKFVSGYWLPGLNFRARFSGDLDLTSATPFQRGWAEGSSVSVKLLRDYADMVPATSFFFGALAGDLGRGFLQFFAALPEDVRRLLDETIISSGKYQGMPDLLDAIGRTLGPNFAFALRRNDYPENVRLDVEHDDAPVPLFVIMARYRDLEDFKRLRKFFIDNSVLFSDPGKTTKVQQVPIGGGDLAHSFESPAIPGTGEFVVQVSGTLRMVLISNSFKYLKEINEVAFVDERDRRATARRLSNQDGFRQTLDQLRSGAKMFLWLKPSEMTHWTDRLTEEIARENFRQEMNASLFRQWRPDEEQRIRTTMFPGLLRLSVQQETQLRDAVDDSLMERADQQWQERRSALVATQRLAWLPVQTLGWAAACLEMGRRHGSLILAGELALD